jgi:hypothetical protein
MRAKYVGNKADKIIMNVKSAEATASIPRGTPVVLNLSSTGSADDGLGVVLPATAGDAATGNMKYGIVTDTLAAGVLGESILFGYCSYAIAVLETRSTPGTGGASWSTMSQASGVGMGIDTVNNALAIGGGTIAGAIASNHQDIILLDSITMTASATNTSDTSTVITKAVRVFVRML